jgi:hypothetical protein
MAARLITNETDWATLAQEGMTAVVDPMVLRCGELFLKGSKQVDDPVAVWELLKTNISSIATFFDQLILREKIPVFNYSDTYDIHLNFEQHSPRSRL